MAKTIISSFEQFKSNLEITDLQASTVSGRQQSVRDAVAEHMTVVGSFVSGSYKRSTLIRPLSSADIDVFIKLSSDYWSQYQSNATGLLDKVKRELLKTYTKTPKISRNGQAVTITFDDFKVDVVPCFGKSGGGYLIPNSNTNNYLSTDPTAHESHWSTRNAALGGKLVPILKMMKQWNREHSDILRSFHLEAMLLEALASYTFTSYAAAVHHCFSEIAWRIDYSVNDPAGYGDNLAGYLTAAQKADVKSRASTAATKCSEAESLSANGFTESAIGKYRIVFGATYYPKYG